MSKSLKDILVVTDMDNTLLIAKEGVPACNKATIELFCALGGRFTVATGRPPESVKAALQDTKLSCPAICCNGSVLYDMEKNRAIDKIFLPYYTARELVFEILEKFPTVGAEIMVEEGRIYLVAANNTTYHHLRDEKLGCIVCQLADVPKNWAKVMFAADPITLSHVEEYCKTLSPVGCYFIATNSVYFEIMPENVNKASGLRNLCDRLDIAIENTIMIGDYFNDIEIMRAAGYAVAVDNAPLEIKQEADEVVSSCKDGGVGEFLYQLIQKYT